MEFCLCIAESYYRLGLFRVEYFAKEEQLNSYKAKLDMSVTAWKLGEPRPLTRQICRV